MIRGRQKEVNDSMIMQLSLNMLNNESVMHCVVVHLCRLQAISLIGTACRLFDTLMTQESASLLKYSFASLNPRYDT